MNYTKPAITLIDTAKSAIQGTPKTINLYDSFPVHVDQSSGAYEADE